MAFLTSRLVAVYFAARSMVIQTLLALDQIGNTIGPGAAAVLWAAVTGERQNVAFADETLSAHAWRAAVRGKLWGKLTCPPIDLMFFWQRQDDNINAVAGRQVKSHCERAFLKEKLRRQLPPEYRG